MDVMLQDNNGRILSTNSIRKKIRIVLDEGGRATVRLDQMALPRGYYTFKSSVGLVETEGEFYYGGDESEFDFLYQAFLKEREEENQKELLEKLQRRKKPAPKELKAFYKISRELEEGHTQYKSQPLKWKSFYQDWGKKYYKFKRSALETVKNDLKDAPEINLTLNKLADDLENMSLGMDLSVRYKTGQEKFSEISTEVSQVIEKVRDTN